MAYTTKYIFEFESDNGTDYLIELQKKQDGTEETPIAPASEIVGWRLIGEYRCNASAKDKLVKYAVTPGDLLRIHLAKDSTGYIACQFQKTGSVSSSDASGQGGKERYIQASWNDGVYKVPEDCYYLIVSAAVGNTTNTVEWVGRLPERRALGQAPVLKQEKRGHVFGTSLSMYVECLVDQEFAELYDPDPTAWKVRLTDQDQARLLWEGYLVPELYSEPDIAPPYDVQVIATDGIGELKFHDFNWSSYMTEVGPNANNWGVLLQYILGFTELGWSSEQDAPAVITPTECREFGQGFEPFIPRAVTNSVNLYNGMSMYEILENVLTALNLYVIRHDNRWVFFHVNDFRYYEQYGQIFLSDDYDWDGIFKGRGLDMVAKLEGEWWPVGQLSTAVEPARKSLTLQHEYTYHGSILGNSDFNGYDPRGGWNWSDSRFVKVHTLPAHFDSQGRYHDADLGYILGTLNSSLVPRGDLYQVINVPQISAPLKVTVRACDLYPVPPTEPNYTPDFKVDLRITLTDGRIFGLTYVEPTDDAPGGYQWKENYYNGILQTLERYPLADVGKARTVEEFSFILPPCPAGSLRAEVAQHGSPYFFVGYFGIGPIEGTSVKGLRVDVAVDNGARMAAEDVTLFAMTGTREAKTLYQDIITGRNGNPIDTVRDSVVTAQRSAEYLAMDYAREVALPRLRSKGRLNFPKGARLPRIFVKGGNPYIIEESSWDLFADELEVDMVSMPATNPEVTQLYVRTEEIH